MPVNWNQLLHAVNQKAWDKLNPNVQKLITTQYKTMVDQVWDAAGKQTQEGYDCNTGAAACPNPVKGKMTLVQPSEADRALLRKVLNESVLPKWAARCNAQCVTDFNATVGKVVGLTAKK